jgi:hypothetical protein
MYQLAVQDQSNATALQHDLLHTTNERLHSYGQSSAVGMSIRIAGTEDPEVIMEPAPSDLGMQGMSPPTWQAHSRDQDDPPALQLQDNMEGEGIAHHSARLPSIPQEPQTAQDPYLVTYPTLLEGVRCYSDASTLPDNLSTFSRIAGLGVNKSNQRR